MNIKIIEELVYCLQFTACSLLPAVYCLQITACSLLPTVYCLQFTAYSLQIICKHNKIRINEYLEDHMVEEQCGFRKGRGCVDVIFRAKRILGKKEWTELAVFLLFIDCGKTPVNGNWHKLWEMMDNKIPNYLLNTIKCI